MFGGNKFCFEYPGEDIKTGSKNVRKKKLPAHLCFYYFVFWAFAAILFEENILPGARKPYVTWPIKILKLNQAQESFYICPPEGGIVPTQVKLVLWTI